VIDRVFVVSSEYIEYSEVSKRERDYIEIMVLIARVRNCPQSSTQPWNICDVMYWIL